MLSKADRTLPSRHACQCRLSHSHVTFLGGPLKYLRFTPGVMSEEASDRSQVCATVFESILLSTQSMTRYWEGRCGPLSGDKASDHISHPIKVYVPSELSRPEPLALIPLFKENSSSVRDGECQECSVARVAMSRLQK